MALDIGGAAGGDDGLGIPAQESAGGELAAGSDGGTTSFSPGAAGGSTASGGGGGAAASGTGESGGTSTGGAQSSGGKVPGLTATEIHIGMAYSESAGAANEAAGVEGATRGDTYRFAELMVDRVNARGGIFGRKVVPVYHVYDGTSTHTAPQQEQEACATYTQDNEVFAVASSGHTTLITCLHQAGVPHFNVQGMRGSQQDLLAQWPRHFEPGNVELNTVARSQIAGLHSKGYFKPRNPAERVKIGLVRYDETGFRHPRPLCNEVVAGPQDVPQDLHRRRVPVR